MTDYAMQRRKQHQDAWFECSNKASATVLQGGQEGASRAVSKKKLDPQ